MFQPQARKKITEKSSAFAAQITLISVRRHPLKHYGFRAAFWKDFGALGNQFWLIFGSPEAGKPSHLEKLLTWVKHFGLKELL